MPLATLDPAAALDDLAPLESLVGDDVHVVAIGETAHAAHEFYALRHRLVRLLVERLGFTALVWEAGFPEAFQVDDYIAGGAGERDRVLCEGMTMQLGRCDEMGQLVDWLRARNAARPADAPPLRFYGCDLPATIAPALRVVAEYVAAVDAGFAARLARLQELAARYGTRAADAHDTTKVVIIGTSVLNEYLAISPADRNEMTALLVDLAARFDALERTYTERSDGDRYEIVRQHLTSAAALDAQLRAVAALMSGDAAACEGNIRDRNMADHVEWLLERHPRIIVLAHNGHIQRTPIATPAGTSAAVDTLGVHLARRWGQRYLAIGTTCAEGEICGMRSQALSDGSYESELYLRDLPAADADVLDHVLASTTTGLTLVDLRSLDQPSAAVIDVARRMRVQDQMLAIDARQAFDMLVHVPRVSLWNSPLNALLADERSVR